MSRSYRHYKFRDASGSVFNDFVAKENASDRMARKTLCHRLAMGEDADYFTTFKRRYYMLFDVWYCNCEYPKGFHGNGFENYDSISNSKSLKEWYTECIRSDGSICSDREVEEMVANLSQKDKARLTRKLHSLYKK